MAGSVTFILKDPTAKIETPIYLLYWYKDIRIKVSTGEKIKPKFWNQGEHRARKTKDFNEGENINTRLEEKETDIKNAARNHLNENGTIFPERLKAEFVGIFRPKPKTEPEPEPEPKERSFFQAIEEFIKNSSNTKGTRVSYQSTLNTLTKFNATLKKDLTFDDINLDFYEDFVKYLTYSVQYKRSKNESDEKIKTGYNSNTIGNRIKNIKVFMNYANDKGYTANTGHKHRKFKKLDETAETIYLNDSELSKLHDLNLSDNPRLDRIRDLFLIGCYTGLRFSDLSQLTPEKFIKDGTQIKIKTQKTGETVIIPLHWTVKEIIQKNGGEPPRAISNQKMNDYIKDLGEKAGINDVIPMTVKQAGLSIDKTFKKWQLMTVHTSRRSFSTNMFLAGVPTISIMKITGHRTERAFMKYIKISPEQNADKLQAHPYFIKPLKVVNQ